MPEADEPPKVGAPLLPPDNPASVEDSRRPWPRTLGPVRTIFLAIAVSIGTIAIMIYALGQILNAR